MCARRVCYAVLQHLLQDAAGLPWATLAAVATARLLPLERQSQQAQQKAKPEGAVACAAMATRHCCHQTGLPAAALARAAVMATPSAGIATRKQNIVSTSARGGFPQVAVATSCAWKKITKRQLCRDTLHKLAAGRILGSGLGREGISFP